MKIHFISLLGRSPWGGSEILWSKVAEQLQSRGAHVTASVKWWPKKSKSIHIANLEKRNIALEYWGKPMPSSRHLMYFIKKAISAFKGETVVYQHGWKIPQKTDLVVINSPGNKFLPDLIFYCRKHRLPYVLICQAVNESNWISDNDFDACRAAYMNAEAVYFVSQANLDSTASQLAYKGNNFRVISNPYNVDRAQFFKPAQNNELHCMAFVGRLEPEHKGLDLLFRALSRPAWRERKYHLNLYGTGMSENQVKEMAKFLGIADHLSFHGHVDCIEKIWEDNALLVLPSRHEGLPLAVIEAMMCGRPCLVTDVSGNPEHIDDGKTGFIAAGATVNAVAAALERAWAQRDHWEVMGLAAYEAIRKAVPLNPVDVFTTEIERLASIQISAKL